MKYLTIHTGALTVHWEDNTGCISVVGSKRVTPRVKHSNIPVFFLKEKFYNSLFFPKYEKSSFMPSDMCTKPFSGPIISWSTKWMNGFRFYPNSETEKHKFMILH